MIDMEQRLRVRQRRAVAAVRLQQGDRWRSGIATFAPEDDVRARVRLSGAAGPRIASYGTAPVSVRIEFTD